MLWYTVYTWADLRKGTTSRYVLNVTTGKNTQTTQICTERIFVLWASVTQKQEQPLNRTKLQQRAHASTVLLHSTTNSNSCYPWSVTMGENMQTTQIRTECIFVLGVSISREWEQPSKRNKVQQRAHQLCFYTAPLTQNRQIARNGLFSQIRSRIM